MIDYQTAKQNVGKAVRKGRRQVSVKKIIIRGGKPDGRNIKAKNKTSNMKNFLDIDFHFRYKLIKDKRSLSYGS